MISKVETKVVAHTNCGDEIHVDLQPQGFIIERKGDQNTSGKITLTPEELKQLLAIAETKFPNARWGMSEQEEANEAQSRG